MSIRRFAGLILIILVLAPNRLLFGLEAFVIDEYDVDVTVGKNNIYLVTEDLSVTFSRPMHGIFRDIPTRYTQPATGRSRRILVENIQVQDHQFRVEQSSSNVNIRIGDPDRYVDGQQHYRISYTLNIGNDNIPEYDEFYLNLIGPQWDTQIRKATFRVNFPKPFDTTMYNLTGGPRGSTDNTLFEHRAEGTTIRASTTRVLQPYEGVTLRVELPEGYFTGAREIRDTFYGKMYLLLIASLLLSGFLWYRYGRDSLVVVPVEFTAPEGMTPAETGYIIDGYTDTKDLTSLLIYWADKGYMSIEEIDEKNYRFQKLMPIPPDAKAFEKAFFDDLFNNRDQVETSELKYKFAESMSAAKKDVTEYFRDDPQSRIFTRKSRWARAFISLMIGLIAGVTVWKVAYESGGKGTGILVPAIIGGVLVMILTGFIQQTLDKWQTIGWTRRFFQLAVPAVILAVFSIIGLSFAGGMPQLQVLVLLTLAVTAVLAYLAFIARKRTDRGIDLLGRILGLKDFIKRAELDRIKMLVEEDPSYFYKVLPFAYSLGLSEKWAEKFTDILTPPPTWYSGSSVRGPGFTPLVFTHSLNNAMRTAETSMAAVKGSSGGGSMSGGGGFSGGGAGGGGGGGW